MKKLALLGATAVLGMLAMSASALPKGYESVNFHGTLTVQNYSSSRDYYYTKVSVSNKDLLLLIATEYGSLPSGAILAYYGTGRSTTDDFAVLYNSGNSVWISDASYKSSASDSYRLWFYPDEDSYAEQFVQGTSDTWDYLFDQGELSYTDSTDTYYFYLEGGATVTDNYDTDNESYNMANVAGYFYLPLDIAYYNYGIMNASLSGSGDDVSTF